MTPRTRMILVGVGAALVCLLFYFFFIRGRQSDLQAVRDQVAAERSKTIELQAELARLEELQDQAPQLQAELAEIRQLVPRNHEVPNFIFLVQDAANEAGVDFVQITPELPDIPPEGAALAEVRATIGAGGGYFAIQDFVRRLYNLDRAVRIDNLTMSGGAAEGEDQAGPTTVTFTGVARIFFETPAAPAPATGTAPAGTAPATTTTPAPAAS